MVRPKPNRSRFTIPGVDRMRAEVSANTASLANAASMSWEVVAEILQEVCKPKTSCERVINGLKKLGHPTADLADIVEHTAPGEDEASSPSV